MSFFNIDNNDIYLRTGAVNQLFDMSARSFSIHKEPIKNINIIPENPLYGYGDIQTSNQQVTYTPVYEAFSGRLIYTHKSQGGASTLFDGKVRLNPDSTYLKMRPEAFRYISNGNKTELIKVDGMSWKLNGRNQVQNYLGLVFYYVELEAVN